MLVNVRVLVGLLIMSNAVVSQRSWERRGNLVTFESAAGSIEVQWISASSYRLQRCRLTNCPTRSGAAAPVEFTVNEQTAALEFRTRYLTMRLDRGSATASVRNRAGKELLTELNPEDALFRAAAADGERFFGLGSRTSEKLDLRGTLVPTSRPLLLSSSGYGLYFAAPAEYTFDLAAARPDRVRVTAGFARRLEYYFYYGPSVKEILEEHLTVTGPITPVSPGQLEILPETALPQHATRVAPMPFVDTLRYLQHAALSGVLTPAVDLSLLPQPAALFFPLLTHPRPPPELVQARSRWLPYLYAYLDEAQSRGIPLLRPLVMQYPDDANSLQNTSAFMIGDELLIPTGSSVHLPMGFWTDLCTNTRHRGRQVIAVERPGACPLVHNGSIVPIDAGRHIELHYFPRLAAEFFLAEPAETRVTQVHAGPAGDYLRLEVESRVARTYEWVVHHVSTFSHVECTGCQSPPSNVRYDEDRGNLHVLVAADVGSDVVLNITLKQPL